MRNPQLQHLKILGFSKSDLDPPQTLAYYNDDGSKMPVALGSFQAKLTYSARSCTGWVDVQGYLSSPLLSWEHCRDLGIVPENFLQQIMNDNRVRSTRGKQAELRTVKCRSLSTPDRSAATSTLGHHIP